MTKFFVHNTSVVDGTSTIGENTKIWHYSHIMQNCLIGKNSEYIYSYKQHYLIK